MSDLGVHQRASRAPIGAGPGGSTVEIESVPPFRLDHTVCALRRRAVNAFDRWDGTTYRRVLVVDGRRLSVEVVQSATAERPLLLASVPDASLDPGTRTALRLALTRLLGLDRDLGAFYRAAAEDPLLWPLVRTFLGLKPPRFPTLFETLVNAIACQQVTLDFGLRLLNRLAETDGNGGHGPGGALAFPSPEALAGREPDELRGLGFSRQKAVAIVGLARAVAEDRADLDALERLDDAEAIARLRTLRGVGRWTAEYALLRGLGRLQVFPGDDVGARNNLRRWLGLAQPLDYDGVARALARWQPFQGLVYFHLLLRRLQVEDEARPGATTP